MSEQRSYSDFDLLIESTGGGGYRARVLNSPVGAAAGSFALPFSDLELENFMLKVGRPPRSRRTTAGLVSRLRRRGERSPWKRDRPAKGRKE